MRLGQNQDSYWYWRYQIISKKLYSLFDNTKINQSQVGLIFRSRYVSKSFAPQRLSFELQQSQQLLCTGDKTIWLVLFFNGQIIIVLCQWQKLVCLLQSDSESVAILFIYDLQEKKEI